MIKVHWILKKPLVNKQQVANFEEKYHINFPSDFTKTVYENNGGRPRPNVFDSTVRKELVAKSLLSFDKDHMDNIWETYDSLKENLPYGIIPFMSDQFGNYICFDYRNNEIPNVVFWDRELSNINSKNSFINVKDNFTNFLNSLYEI